MSDQGPLWPVGDTSAIECVENILAYIGRVPDPELRAAFVGEKLLALTDDNVVRAIALIHRRARQADHGALDTWGVLVNPRTLAERLDAYRRSRIFHCATRLGVREVVSLFSKGRPARTSARADEDFLIYGLAGQTVGRRVSKARDTDRETRSKIMYDANPQVIEAYLQNTRTTEADVVRLAARRPSSIEILETIYRSARWITRYTVKLALARNPYTPENLANNLLPHLLLTDLLEIQDDRSLCDSVRENAGKFIESRRALRDRPARDDGRA
ncbi:MAG: hypothetical protein KJ042_02945 [Deltaproteobacteria bacterium]|nr:hypothetical protein [Deltaproteobacteria bacterium]